MTFYCVIAINLIKNGFVVMRLGTVEAQTLPQNETIKRPPYKEITKTYFKTLKEAKRFCNKNYKPVSRNPFKAVNSIFNRKE